MKTSAHSLKLPRTMLELFKQLPEGTAVQLIQNQIVMSPPSFERHQALLMEINAELHRFTREHKAGVVRTAP